MSANSKWPDFGRASSLWGLVGSKSKDHDSPEPATDAASRQENDEDNKERNGAPVMEDPNDQVAIMTDIESRPIDGLGGFNDVDDDAQDGGMDAEFGPLEMFDSSAVGQPFASQGNDADFEKNGQAPAAVMSTEEPPVETKKHKRDKGKKKKKKKKKKHDGVSEPHEEGHHKRAKRTSAIDMDDALPPTGAGRAISQELGEDDATQAKRKRRHSDGVGEKRRKKQKSLDDVPEDTVEGANVDANTGFLRTDSPSRIAPAADMAEGDIVEPDPQGSPSVARLRRRSQSFEARSRDASTAREAAPDQASEDGDARSKRDPVAIETLDVENLAREAWNEHINGQAVQGLDLTQAENPETADTEMRDAEQPEENRVDAENQEPPATTPRPKRTSTRKKSKPTFFDQPPEVQEADLPSPSAITPKPRRRAKAATRKQRPAPRSPQLAYNSDDDVNQIDAPKGRRNRMDGYTKGRFTDDELERIANQVHAFAEENNLEQFQVNEMIQAQGGTSAGESHAQLWNRLFAECPDRHRQKVINIARKKFHNFVARGTWTAEQDAELAMLIDIHGTKWSKIAALINRHPEDLRDRYRNYVICGDSQRKDAWTEQEEQSLAHHVIENMAEIDRLRITQPDRILLQKTYEELIDWQDISERMGRTRSRLQCITKWKAMNMKTHGKDQLASLQPDSQVTFHLDKARRQIEDMPATERYRLLLAIRDCKSTSDATIAWSRLLDKDYRSQWHRGTMGLLWHRLKKTVPGHQSKPIRDCAQQLISEYDHSGELPFVDGDGYSDIEEMQVVQATADPVRVGRQKQKREKSKTSEDLVGTSDDEEDEAEEAQDGGMQIDPALMSEGAEAAPEDGIEYEPEDEPTATHKKSTPRKKTSAKRGANTSTKKRASTKKGMLSQDPIEDDEPAQDEAAAPQGEDADAVEDTPRKKRASTRAGRSKKRDAAPLPPPPESSDMEDMGDVPARIPA